MITGFSRRLCFALFLLCILIIYLNDIVDSYQLMNNLLVIVASRDAGVLLMMLMPRKELLSYVFPAVS